MEVEKRDKDGGEDGGEEETDEGEEETDEGRQYITFSLLFGVSRAEIFLNIWDQVPIHKIPPINKIVDNLR